jgi:hypothetical protein
MTASGYGTFAHGGVRYPLTADTTNSLLQDADPALFYALDFIAGVLQIHIGDRLAAEGAKVGLDLSVAVRKKIHVEPSPVMTADQMLFPCLAIYRKEDNWDAHTAVYDKDVSTWELAYVMPPLTPVQLDALQPILRAVGVVIENRIWQGFDPAYQGGALIGAIAPIHKAFVKKIVYGGYQPIDNLSKYYRAIVVTLMVWERDVSIDDDTQWPEMTGVDASIDETSRDGTKVTDFVQVKTSPAPAVTSASPNSATKAGGTTVTLACTGLRAGTPVTVTIGGKTCPSAVVTNATAATVVTPQHDAYDTYIADVVLTADDGQVATLVAGFTFTTP